MRIYTIEQRKRELLRHKLAKKGQKAPPLVRPCIKCGSLDTPRKGKPICKDCQVHTVRKNKKPPRPCVVCGSLETMPKGVPKCTNCIVAGKEKYNNDPKELERSREYIKRYWQDPKQKGKRRQYQYGISPEDQEKLLAAQGGKCPICKAILHDDRGSHDRDKMQLDHDHKTNEIRGFLTGRCNRLIELANDSPYILRAAANYLESFQEGLENRRLTMGIWHTRIVKGGDQKVLQPRVFVYGPPGVGKSSLAAKLPRPVFVDLDKGIDDVSVDRIPAPDTWEEVMSTIRDIATDPNGYRSLVLDTVDPLEELVIEYVLKRSGKKSLADFDFGAGYNAVAMEWKVMLAELDVARKNGMLVCLIGHSIVRQAVDPTLGTFDQFTANLGKKTWALTLRWADLVGFACFDSALVDKKDESRVIVTGERLLMTVRGSGYEAKNRFSLEQKLPLSWPAVEAGIARHRQSSEAIKAKILKLAAGTALEEKAMGYLEVAGDDVGALLELETNLTKALQAPPVPQVVPAASNPVPTNPAPTNDRAPAAADTSSVPYQSPQASPEAIELRIFQLAKGTPYEARAKENVTNAAKDLKALLMIEEALTAKLAEVKNGAQVTA